jgi:hypothetical protein
MITKLMNSDELINYLELFTEDEDEPMPVCVFPITSRDILSVNEVGIGYVDDTGEKWCWSHDMSDEDKIKFTKKVIVITVV